MKHLGRIVSLLLAITFIISCAAVSVNADASLGDEAYKQSLRDKGFPESYVTRLADLHVSHPLWKFEPLMITELKSQYTWDYIIDMELWGTSEGEGNNLIDAKSGYEAYWMYYSTSYDSGKCPASGDTVRFFMDPRNFFNEKRMFLFKDLNYDESTHIATVEAVNRIFSGTFMYNAVVPGSDNTRGLTYAQVVYETAVSVGIDPMFIASRLRQEKGVDGNTKPLLNGSCGDTLYTYYKNKTDGAPSSGYSYSSLTQYNNLYNYFNIEAWGDGYFNIYLHAMQESKNEGWNTHMKALTGGISKVKARYIDQYQNTLYLQKFNIDPRAGDRNFEGQFMQTIYATYSEAYSSFQGYIEYDLVDYPYTFSIPVISGMPSTPQGDPGTKFTDTNSFCNHIETPGAHDPAGSVIRDSVTLDFANSSVFNFGGWSAHTVARTQYTCSVDGGDWMPLNSFWREDVQNAVGGYVHSPYNAFNYSINLESYGLGTHVVRVRGELTGGYTYPIASFTVLCVAEGGEIEITSGDYSLGTTASGKTLTNISAGQTIPELLGDLNGDCIIRDENGNKVTTGILKTGYTVQYYKYSTVFDEAIIIVTADTTCDGIVNGKDLIRAKKMANSMADGFIEAADIDGNNSISQSDLKSITDLIAN